MSRGSIHYSSPDSNIGIHRTNSSGYASLATKSSYKKENSSTPYTILQCLVYEEIIEAYQQASGLSCSNFFHVNFIEFTCCNFVNYCNMYLHICGMPYSWIFLLLTSCKIV